jgi:IS30 family transposase
MRCKHLISLRDITSKLNGKIKCLKARSRKRSDDVKAQFLVNLKETARKGYLHNQTNILSHERQSSKIKSVKMTEEMKYIVSVCILNGWSPEQVSGRLAENVLSSVHHETIYQYILSGKKNEGQLCKHLRRQRKNIGNAADSLTTALGFQIAETLTNALPW